MEGKGFAALCVNWGIAQGKLRMSPATQPPSATGFAHLTGDKTKMKMYNTTASQRLSTANGKLSQFNLSFTTKMTTSNASSIASLPHAQC